MSVEARELIEDQDPEVVAEVATTTEDIRTIYRTILIL